MVLFPPLVPVALAILLHLAAFFVICMVCHGELAATRPPARHLTEFYLWMSAGGVLGGLLNALVGPLLFRTVFEYPLMIVLACAPAAAGRLGIYRSLAAAGGNLAFGQFAASSGRAAAGGVGMVAGLPTAGVAGGAGGRRGCAAPALLRGKHGRQQGLCWNTRARSWP